MQLSNAPAQIVEAWATAGSKTNPIPVPSQVGITPGAASWTTGFPPLCDTPLLSGGIPPSMQDMNGGLYQMSAVDVWMCAGGGFPYNSAFSASIGGYPKGARVLMASGNGYWVSTTDNNVTDPDTGGAGWASANENAITALTGDVSATGPGSAAATLAATGVTAGSYLGANITVDSKGRVTSAAGGAFAFTGTAGYQKLPSGIIIQFGHFAATSVQATPITSNFPENFPTSCLFCHVTGMNANGTDYNASMVINTISYTASGVTYTGNGYSGYSVTPEFFAIGY